MAVSYLIKNIIEQILPDSIIEWIGNLFKLDYFPVKKKIRKYFLSLNKYEQETEIAEIINYLEKHRLTAIPYDFCRKYHTKNIAVYYDKTSELLYVYHNNKRLFFPYNNKEAVRTYYKGLCIEQDKNSPHRYATEEFIAKTGDIIADIGAAEGIWALDNAEKVGKIYLFECQNKWINALEKTFEPWKEKTVIINKYVSNTDEGNNVTLDNIFVKDKINIIKADIEGMEIKLLEGSKKLLISAENLRLLLCTYHQKDDAEKIKEILENNGYMTEYSKGYIFHITDRKLDEPYIRRGIIRAKKKPRE
jgi:ribosomal protein L7/L12